MLSIYFDLQIVSTFLKEYGLTLLFLFCIQSIIIILSLKDKATAFRFSILLLIAYCVKLVLVYVSLTCSSLLDLTERAKALMYVLEWFALYIIIFLAGYLIFSERLFYPFLSKKTFVSETLRYCKNFTILAIIIELLFYLTMGTNPSEKGFPKGKILSFPSGIIFILYAVVIVPFVEEIFFRGIVWRSLHQQGNQYAAVISSAVWVLIYKDAMSWPYLFILGLFFCRLYRRTDNIKSSILFHAYINVFMLCGSLLTK